MKTYTITLNEEQLQLVKDAIFLSGWSSYKLDSMSSFERKRDLYHYLELFSE